ncbi:MAG: iron-containing alcohol dehydrogenase [Comamonadaceae bacterium]|nr:MAG: iron-containing alcohol dehydrogenase [Comamonadaceae bacterium]
MSPRFDFTTVASLTVRAGAVQTLGTLLTERYAPTRLCLVTDKFLHQSGMLAGPLANLADTGWEVLVIDDVVADPPDDVVLACAAQTRAFNARLVVGLGGGSSMDVAKLVAVLAASDQPLAAMYGIGNVQGPRLPLIQIPTTAGTGSEVTPISIVTTGKHTKSGIVSPVLYADWAILDASLTLGLPPHATAATGIDAMVHAIEAYTSARLKNPLSDALAREALRLLSANLLTACNDGHNQTAREAMLLGATLAGQAFANAPVAAVHALAFPLGGHFHVPHGLSNALVLTEVLTFNLSHAQQQYAELAGCMGVALTSSDPADRARDLITHIDRLIAATGIARRLRDVGVAENDLDMLARDAMQQQRLLMNNPREVGLADARAIYAAVW